MFAWHFKEHLLEMWQTFVRIGNPSKKLINEDIIIPQDFQRGGPKNKQLKIIKFKYSIIGREKCQSWHVPPHPKKR
jgi:hypothetical protein